MKKLSFLFFILVLAGVGCTKTYRVAKPTLPKLYTKTYSAGPNSIYYALRWAMRANDYPIAEEDFQNGVIKSRYVPVKAHSHYVAIFNRKDYGVTGAYHQLQIRLVPEGQGSTKVEIGSRIQGVVSNLLSSGNEEKRILQKISNYLRNPHVQVTNQGVQE